MFHWSVFKIYFSFSKPYEEYININSWKSLVCRCKTHFLDFISKQNIGLFCTSVYKRCKCKPFTATKLQIQLKNIFTWLVLVLVSRAETNMSTFLVCWLFGSISLELHSAPTTLEHALCGLMLPLPTCVADPVGLTPQWCMCLPRERRRRWSAGCSGGADPGSDLSCVRRPVHTGRRERRRQVG